MATRTNTHMTALSRLLAGTGFLAAMALSASARAENIDLLLSSLFQTDGPTYIGATSVNRDDIPDSANYAKKYLIVDFRFRQQPPDSSLQASIHTICMAMIRDHDLMQRLTHQGYDMVSVAFDRRSQYDCL